MKLRRGQLFLVGLLLTVTWPELVLALVQGRPYRLSLNDVDGHALSTAEGKTTILVVASAGTADKARIVGDRTPDKCIGNSVYRMVTIVRFSQRQPQALRSFLSAIIRRRLDGEARRLEPRYRAKRLT